MRLVYELIDRVSRALGRHGLERCGVPDCHGVLTFTGVCTRCGYDW